MIIHDFNDNEFDTLISKGIVLLDFYADWCGPCKMLSPVLDSLNNELDINIIKINVDKHKELSRKYGVMTIPTLVLIKNGLQVKKNIGFINLDMLKKWINE